MRLIAGYRLGVIAIAMISGICGMRAWAAQPALEDGATKVTSVAEMFAGSDREKDPLEIEMLREWDEDGVHFEEMYFTGQITYGEKTRVYAFRGAAIAGTNLPGMLHGHGGGGSASLQAVEFSAQRGYVCVSYDYSGKLPGRTKCTDFGSAILGQREGKPAGPGDLRTGGGTSGSA